jgi:serine/threonine protein kinase
MDGTPFGRYRLVKVLGRGGMGEVWRAYDTDTDRVVAFKVLPPHLAQDSGFSERFRREAHAAASSLLANAERLLDELPAILPAEVLAAKLPR